MNKRIYIKIIAAILCSLLAACQGKKEQEEEVKDSTAISLTKKQVASSNLILGSASKSKMSAIIASQGTVDVPPQYKASVSTPIGGFVKATEVLEGDHVHKGEVLAVLSHEEYVHMQQQFLEAKSKYVLAEKQLARQRELREENINSQKKLEETEAELKVSLAQLKALEAKLKMIGINPDKVSEGAIATTIELRSPIDGDIAMVNTSIGKFSRPEDVMFEIISKDHLHLDLKVYERDVLKIQEGQKLVYTVGNEGDERSATIILVGKKLDPISRTVSIHAHPESSERLLPGMYVNAKIFSAERLVQTLPEDAVVQEEDKHYVFVKVSEKDGAWYFKKILVDAGNTVDGLIEIRNPSMDAYKNSIVLKGAYYIQSSTLSAPEEE